jgi:hypothetical protein
VLIAPVVVFTGCVSKQALQPQIYLFTIANNGQWLRLSYFGKCWGEGDLKSAPKGCAPYAQKIDDGIAKYAAGIQNTALFPALALLASILFMFSSIAFNITVYETFQPQNKTLHKLTFGVGFWSIFLSIGALIQIWSSIYGIANAFNVAENAGLKVQKNEPIIAIQGATIIIEIVFMLFMWFFWRNTAKSIRIHGYSGQYTGSSRKHGESSHGHSGNHHKERSHGHSRRHHDVPIEMTRSHHGASMTV